MAFSYPITIVDSNISVNGDVITNTSEGSANQVGRLITHDISGQISQGDLSFELSPQPVLETLIVSLDGLILTPGEDYSVSNTTLSLLFDQPLNASSKLLAIYEEA